MVITKALVLLLAVFIYSSIQVGSHWEWVMFPVALAEDVQTNPQSGVGGIEEVNELFAGEDIGKGTSIEPEKSKTSPLLFVLGGVVVISVGLLGFIMLAKRQKDEEDTPQRLETEAYLTR